MTDCTRFALTPAGLDALHDARIVPGCPLCGCPLVKVSERFGAFYECDNPDPLACFYTVRAAELEAAK